VLFTYSPELVDKIRTVPGRCWHEDEKLWSVPHDRQAIPRLMELFSGQRVLLAPILAPRHPAAPCGAAEPLLDALRSAVRTRRLSPATERSYLGWARRFLSKNPAVRPEDLGETEVGRFLSDLAETGVSASTQNQALNAVAFLFLHVLGRRLGMLEGVVRAKRPHKLPVVLSRNEVRDILERMDGTPKLMALLLYGSGLRLMECCELRLSRASCTSSRLFAFAQRNQ
jgi:site-specific recombinase XerD